MNPKLPLFLLAACLQSSFWPDGKPPAPANNPHSEIWALTITLCLSVAFALLLVMLIDTVTRPRRPPHSARDAQLAAERIYNAVFVLYKLKDEMLRAYCKAVIKDMRKSMDFASYELHRSYYHYADNRLYDPQIVGCLISVMRGNRQLPRYLAVTSLLLSFKPFLLRSRNRTLQAARMHVELWAAFVKHARDQHPELHGFYLPRA